MGQQFPSIEDRHREFIEKQHIFFVATAAPEGRVSLSPKGMNSFRVLGANEVAYLDVTGSGSETSAADQLAKLRHVQIAGEIGPQVVESVRLEETQTPLTRAGEIARVNAEAFEGTAPRR